MKVRDIAFDGHRISIEFGVAEIDALIDFLFLDLDHRAGADVDAVFRIELMAEQSQWRLTRNKTQLFLGDSLNDLGSVLAGEALFSLIENNRYRMAIHAGLVSNTQGCVLLPADSGSGKSSVTTWLLTQGWHYHTDELVLIDLENGKLQAFTRPLNIKPAGLEAISEIIDLKKITHDLRAGSITTMIPHRLINPQFNRQIPQLNLIVFPHYSADTKPSMSKLSGAQAGLELMRSNVIARNLSGHGFNHVVNLVRNIPAYRLRYQHFDDLESLFERIGARS
ncbi:MAG: hypothetical protein ACR2QW_05235 [bacterium]